MLKFLEIYECISSPLIPALGCNRLNTRKSVSSGYPNPEKCVEKRGRRTSFFKNFEVFGYPDKTLFRVFDLASQTNQYLKRKLR